MSREALEHVLNLARDDAGFAAQLATDPSALNGFDLTVEERRALVDHDRERLLDFGVDVDLLEALPAIARWSGPGTATRS